MATPATGQPRARQSPTTTQRLGRQQTGHRASLDLEGNLPALLELPLADLGALLPGLLDLAGLAQPNRADDESRPHVARPPRTAPELVPGQRRGLQWRCRGLEQQDSSGDQKVLRLSDLRCYGNSHVSHARPTARAGINPQILLTRLFFEPIPLFPARSCTIRPR